MYKDITIEKIINTLQRKHKYNLVEFDKNNNKVMTPPPLFHELKNDENYLRNHQ